jgi:hypothetical protein
MLLKKFSVDGHCRVREIELRNVLSGDEMNVAVIDFVSSDDHADSFARECLL